MCCREILYSGTRWGGRSTVVSFFFYPSVKPPRYYCSSRAYFSLIFFRFNSFILAPDRDHLLCRAHDEQARDDLQFASKNYRILSFFFVSLTNPMYITRTYVVYPATLNRHSDHLTVKRLPFSSYQCQWF